ncbi:hypothetical protein [Allorhizocola rhizosphaerae]|uniref:hypothetical protein n=1 Tax=Allorhizocola rhizosphaerae TaxID=1872709 RepID=UPI000E3EE04A|nr:hypothetical protein [Allorhizocola rhizosphaerae]
MGPLLAVRPLFAALLAVGAIVVVWPAEAEAAVTKRLAIVMIQNGDTDGERAQLADPGYIAGVFFGPGNSLRTWMGAVTHGQLSYVPAGIGIYQVQPNDELRNGDRSRCHADAAKDTAEDFMATTGVSWDALAVVFDTGSCPWAGLGQMPGRVTWYPPRPSLSAIVHEMGHNQGYPHQPKKDCAGGSMAACRPSGYSGNTPMGSGGAGRGYSSVELLHSQWIERTLASKPGTFSLKPLYSTGGGTRALEYRTGGPLSYVIELRAAVSGVDSSIRTPGVRVYAVTGGDYKNAYMVNPTPAGSTITDTANKITIKVKSATSSGATVAIEAIGAGQASSKTSANPAASSTPEEPTPSADAGEPPDEDDFLPNLADAPQVPKRSFGWVYVVAGIGFALASFGMWYGKPRKGRHRAPGPVGFSRRS